MKIDIKSLDEIFDNSLKDGLFKKQSFIDLERIKSLVQSAEIGLERLKSIGESFEKKHGNYSFYLTDHYEILRLLIEAFLFLHKIKADTHQAAFSFICKKHSDLEFDWKSLETARILRNGVAYEGYLVKPEQWNMIKTQFKINIISLLKIIKEKIKQL